ncbi:MAG: pre-16S rRNA-processing nuclease YqgF [Selenomonadaceae bacterium]|nr:pre-16S rRNA-processing nuclease YqgF [Selenomonadaceae bacterium]
MIMGVDPGRDKCGVAVLNSAGEVKFSEVIPTENFDTAIKKLAAQFEIEQVIFGNGTTHVDAEKKIRAINLPIKIIDEKFTTEEARREYWVQNPPRGWRRLLPVSMQVPPVPVDNIVAEILAKRFLVSSG